MRKSLIVAMVLALLTAGVGPAAAASRDTLQDFTSLVPVNTNPPTAGEVFCKELKRSEKKDGTAKETQQCELTGTFYVIDYDLNEFVLCAEAECGPPEGKFNMTGGPCEWWSDYWYLQEESVDVLADGWELSISKKGKVHATSTYPAVPIDCDTGTE